MSRIIPIKRSSTRFFGALEKGEEMPLTNLAQALRSHEVIFAADHSADIHAKKKH